MVTSQDTSRMAESAPTMPPGLLLTRTTPEFTDSTVPPGLLRAHQVAPDVWGRVRVLSGALRFVFEDSPGTTHQLEAGSSLDIPPATAHRVEPAAGVRFVVEFYRSAPAPAPSSPAVAPLFNSIRPFRGPVDDPRPGQHEPRVLVQLETVTALAIRPDPGDAARRCPSDQYLFTVEGSLDVHLGDRVLTADQGALVFVPAGVPHRLVDRGDSRVLDLVVPSPTAGERLFEPADLDEPQPGGFVSPLGAEAFAAGSRAGGFAVQTLTDPAKGSMSCVVNAAQVAGGGAGPSMHIHTFDQLFFVLQGQLEVDIAGQRASAERHDLVVLPAGVPHTQWNEGQETEVHLAVLVPPPVTGEPVTRPVEFRVR